MGLGGSGQLARPSHRGHWDKVSLAVDDNTRIDLEQRLDQYLAARGDCYGPSLIGAGGSAAIFRVTSSEGPRAIKVYEPRLFVGRAGDQTRRRLELQRNLIGHSCPYLIHTHRVDEAEDTAFVEMELVEWPQLRERLDLVPEESVGPLIAQLALILRENSVGGPGCLFLPVERLAPGYFRRSVVSAAGGRA